MIPLHVHSYYTLLKGTISPEKLIAKAVEYKLKAMALTDINSMQGIIQFVKHARENKIKAIMIAYKIKLKGVFALLLEVNKCLISFKSAGNFIIAKARIINANKCMASNIVI